MSDPLDTTRLMPAVRPSLVDWLEAHVLWFYLLLVSLVVLACLR